MASPLKKGKQGENNPLKEVNKYVKQFGLSLALMIGGLSVFQGTAIADTILDVQTGTASIENSTQRRLRAASPGTSLRVGDLIRPYLDAVVVIRCNSGSVRRVRSLVGLGDICPDSVGRRFTDTGRGEDDFLQFLNGLFTYSTQVAEAQPELRWNPVEGASAYHVQLLQNDEVIWEESVTSTRMFYSGEGLEAGGSYTFIVTALAEGDETDGGEVVQRSRLVLRRVNDAEAASVRDAVAQVEGQELSDAGRAIALAQVYQGVAQPNTLPPEGSGLMLELIPVLEAVLDAGNQIPYLHRLLGDGYVQVGLVDDAQRQYEAVIRLTPTGQDLASRGAAWVGLANIAAVDDDAVSAGEYLQLAQVNYRAIADTNRVERIDEWLGKLN